MILAGDATTKHHLFLGGEGSNRYSKPFSMFFLQDMVRKLSLIDRSQDSIPILIQQLPLWIRPSTTFPTRWNFSSSFLFMNRFDFHGCRWWIWPDLWGIRRGKNFESIWSFLIFWGGFFFPSLLLLLCHIYVKGGFCTLLPRVVALDVSIDWLLEAIPFSCSLLHISWLFVHCNMQVKTSSKTRNKKDYGLIANLHPKKIGP
jgi:hypothetical protein